ncbi:MAG: DNA-processing protein DprA [Candidatus Dormibacteria bacterium]
MTGRRWLPRHGEGWPPELEHLTQPPAGLWLDGSGRLGDLGVAVVGARRATLGGLEIARSIATELIGLGVTVISGFARGIDAAAHGGALDAGGGTVAVLGCGLDIDYPREHGGLRERVRAGGLLVTEYPSQRTPEGFLFPRRNRLIAALARVVVVVEATERSGALSTARWAADLGREVLAVPGSIRAEQHHGCNLLIRDGVRPYLGVEDLVESIPELGLTVVPATRAQGGRTALSAPLRTLLDRLGADPIHPDTVAALLGLDAAETAARLSALELAGAVRSLPGGLVLRATG